MDQVGSPPSKGRPGPPTSTWPVRKPTSPAVSAGNAYAVKNTFVEVEVPEEEEDETSSSPVPADQASPEKGTGPVVKEEDKTPSSAVPADQASPKQGNGLVVKDQVGSPPSKGPPTSTWPVRKPISPAVSAGNGLVVKNTFLDFEEAPPEMPGELSREKTNPLTSQSTFMDDEEESKFCSTEPDSDQEERGRLLTGDNYQIDRVEQADQWTMGMMPPGIPPAPATPAPDLDHLGMMDPGIPPAPATPAPDLDHLGCVNDPGEPPATDASGNGQELADPIDFSLIKEAPPVRPAELQRTLSTTRPSLHRITWRVDERKLKKTDTKHVSPVFLVSFANTSVQFRMVIRPKATSEQRGGASFKQAKGKGHVELRCLDRQSEAPDEAKDWRVHFSIAVHPDSEPAPGDFRPSDGPVVHDFSAEPNAGLPKECDEWDFSKAVKGSAFYVSVKINSAPQ